MGWLINPFRFGSFNVNSFLLDGVNEYFEIAHNNAMNLSYNTATTIGIWVRFQTLGAGAYLITKRNTATNLDGWQLTKNSSDQITFVLRNHTGTEILQVRTTSAVILNTTDWYHISVEKPTNSTAANTIIYVNGVAQTMTVVTDTMTSHTYSNSTTLRIGRIVTDNTAHLHGYITSPYMINKDLSSGERAEVHNGGKPISILNTSLSANLIFQLGTSTNTAQFTWYDESANNYDATSFNMETADKTTIIP